MGDRRNVIVRDNDSTVYLYTHWSGSELPKIVQSALNRGASRFDDGPYLARIIFAEMTKDDPMGITGFGISGTLGDTDYSGAEIEISINQQTVAIGNRSWPFAEYGTADLESVAS